MSATCRFYVGFMSVFESELKSYMIENMIFTEKYMSDVGKFAKKRLRVLTISVRVI